MCANKKAAVAAAVNEMDRGEDRRVWRAASDIAEAVWGSETAPELGRQVMAVVDRLVTCDFGSILSAAPSREWTLHAEKEDNQIIRQNHWRYATEMSRDELAQLGERFSLDTELFPTGRRERMSVYHDFMRPNRQAGFIARYWPMDGQLWGFGMSRGYRTFSADDRRRLDAIFPHLRAALRAGRWLASGERVRQHDGAQWSLTAVERRTTSLVVRGLTNSEAASLLGVSPHTVRNTLARIFEKVGVSRRSELAFIMRDEPDERLVSVGHGPDYRRRIEATEAIGHVAEAASPAMTVLG
jgi:DNA-binding CsgD family transcriptional regulator